MGYGDDLMVTAFASDIKKKYPERQIVIGNVKKKQAYHSIVYDNNPNISNCNKLDPKKPIHIIDYHQGNRPYINYKKSKQDGKYSWNQDFRPQPGQIFFSKEENNKSLLIINNAIKYWPKKNKKKYKALIFLESSSIKKDDLQFGTKHQNKDLGEENWFKLVNKIKNDFLIIQSQHDKTKKIENIYTTNKINFREACSVLNKCDLYLGLEGGFGHAAAALNKKAVIYFGGWISPEVVGYSFHKNIYYESSKSPCGIFLEKCKHCDEARRKITPNIIEKEIYSILNL